MLYFRNVLLKCLKTQKWFFVELKRDKLYFFQSEISEKKFIRPTWLPLKAGTFVAKKPLGSVGPGPQPVALVSPETPRPRKSYGQLYLNGHAYTYLGLKCSSRMFFCTLNKPQPIYVPLSPEHSTLSMYSNWKVIFSCIICYTVFFSYTILINIFF